MLTGSQNLLLLRSVSQSLPGRAAVLHLLPLSLAELNGREPLDLAAEGEPARTSRTTSADLFETLITGSYPAIHDRRMDAGVWLADYYRTYVERDVRELVTVGDLEAFGRFVRLCAGRSGHLLKLSELAVDAGVSHTTARRWLSVLEASFLIALLRPHHRSFNKRLIKAPKLYFLDTGLLCYLLRIRSAEELMIHAARGPVFETFVVSELLKAAYNRGEEPDLYFWRDSSGHEVDVLADRGTEQMPVEEVGTDHRRRLLRRPALLAQAGATSPGTLVYAGDRSFTRDGFRVVSWGEL